MQVGGIFFRAQQIPRHLHAKETSAILLELLVLDVAVYPRLAGRCASLRYRRRLAVIRRPFNAIELCLTDPAFRVLLPAPTGNSMSHVSTSSSFVYANHRL